MVASQQSLTTPATNTRPLTPVNPSQHLVTTRSDLISAIAYNLPPNYFEESDPVHGYRWFGVSQKSSFRTEIYLNAAKRRINISVFDNKGKTIKPWSTTLRMTGNWRRRLRRGADRRGERAHDPAADRPGARPRAAGRGASPAASSATASCVSSATTDDMSWSSCAALKRSRANCCSA